MNSRSLIHAESLREKFRVTPLEYMLSVVNNPKASSARRDAAAKAAAPYMHSRLAAIEVPPEKPPEQKLRMDDTKLTNEEVVELHRLMGKIRWVPNDGSEGKQPAIRMRAA